MVLLEFHYWTDVVMWCGVLNLVGIIWVLILAYRLLKGVTPIPTEGEKKWSVNQIVFFNHQIKIGGSLIMVQAQVDQKFGVTWPAPTDKYGNATTVENVTFSSDDENLATIEADPATGPYSAIVHTNSTPGATAVRIKADPKKGEPVGEIEGILAVEITSGEAQGFGEPSNTPPEEDDDDN